MGHDRAPRSPMVDPERRALRGRRRLQRRDRLRWAARRPISAAIRGGGQADRDLSQPHELRDLARLRAAVPHEGHQRSVRASTRGRTPTRMRRRAHPTTHPPPAPVTFLDKSASLVRDGLAAVVDESADSSVAVVPWNGDIPTVLHDRRRTTAAAGGHARRSSSSHGPDGVAVLGLHATSLDRAADIRRHRSATT